MAVLVSWATVDAAAEPVAWTHGTAVSASGNTLTKVGVAGWNAGAVSSKAIAAGDGFVVFTANEENTNRICGLNHGSAGNSDADIDFGIRLSSDGTYSVQESGVATGVL